jgi:hypothetical protein
MLIAPGPAVLISCPLAALGHDLSSAAFSVFLLRGGIARQFFDQDLIDLRRPTLHGSIASVPVASPIATGSLAGNVAFKA